MGDIDAGYSTGTNSSEELELQEDILVDEENPLPHMHQLDYDAFLNHLGISNNVIPDINATQEELSRIRSERIKRNADFMENISSEKSNSIKHQPITKEDAAATTIQKCYRGFLGRKIYFNKLQCKLEEEESERRLKQLQQIEEGELLVQTHVLEVEWATELLAIKYRKHRKQHHAIVIQRAWRKYRKLIEN